MIKERIAVQPGAPLETDVWLDTSGEAPILKVFLNGQWVPISGGSATPDSGGGDGSGSGDGSGDGGSVPSEGITLDDLILYSTATSLPAQCTGTLEEVAEALGVTPEQFSKAMSGDYFYFSVSYYLEEDEETYTVRLPLALVSSPYNAFFTYTDNGNKTEIKLDDSGDHYGFWVTDELGWLPVESSGTSD